MTTFLNLSERTQKPREHGITHVIDRGLSVRQVDDLVEVAGEYTDLVKLGWGTAVATRNLEAKLARYREAELPVVLGGTLTELALAQDKLDELINWVQELGLTFIELSDGVLEIRHERKLELIAQLAERFTVLSEVGSKDVQKIMAPRHWVSQISSELGAGAWRVIAEARESGTAGIFRPDGEVRTGLIDEIAHGIDTDRVIFEAPRREQQAWFIKRFGPNVNLGNIPPEDVLTLETLRLGLRADTFEQPETVDVNPTG